MAAVEARCPHCQARFLVPAEQVGQPAKCGRCRKPFTPTAPPVPAPVPKAAPIPVAVALPPPAPKPVVRAAELPPSRHDDDEDDRPRRRPRKPAPKPAAIHPGLLIGGGAAAVLLLVGLIGLVVYLAPSSDPEPVPASPTAGPAYVTAGPAMPPAPAPAPSQAPPRPAATGKPEAVADAVRRVKASTVYIRVHSRMGLSSGSGFFAGEPGYVVTNSHVVGFEPGKVDLPHRIEVVVDSGEPTKRTFDHPRVRLVALDVENDLALLWVDGRGEARPMPPPLRFGRSAALVETQDVFIYGYPFGEKLGENISVNKSTVSSLRKD